MPHAHRTVAHTADVRMEASARGVPGWVGPSALLQVRRSTHGVSLHELRF
jgi:hypothetical protein